MPGGVTFTSPYMANNATGRVASTPSWATPGVPGWGVGAQNGGYTVGNMGGMGGGRNTSFAAPSGQNPLATTPSQPNWIGGGGGDIGTPSNPMPPYLYKQYGSPLPPPGPAAPATPDFLTQLMQSLLSPAGGTGTVKSSYDLKGALNDVAGVYNPQLSALDQLIAQKKGNANDNAAKLKALYASLVSGTQQAGVQGDQHYTDLMGKQSAATQAERDAITQRYAAQIADMQKQMTASGFANLIPVRTQKIQDQMNHELANINTQGDIAHTQSQGLQGAQHNWYGESANVNAGQGVNAQAANMRQLQDALNQISQQRGTILSNEAQAQMGAKNANRASISAAQAASNKAAIPDYGLVLKVWQAQQDQKNATTKAAADAAQQKLDNAIKIYTAGKGAVSPTTGQSTVDPNAIKQIMAGMQ